MKKTRVWFNHWFSTAFHIINLMKREESCEIYFIGSNRNADSVVQLACDEWYTEPPVMSDNDYVDFCLDFCRKHEIDVFVPRRGMNVISLNAVRFRDAGVKLFLDAENPAVGIFRNKAETYRFFANTDCGFVPMYFEIGSVNEFEQAYKAVTAEYARACFKFSEDEGAVSFRVIDNAMESEKALYNSPGMKISYEAAIKILSAYGFKNRIIVMPYLDGYEVSADCLRTSSGNIIIPRVKSNGRIYTIDYDKEIINYCECILELSKLEMPCNIQFKYCDGKPYLLEINTRMSGGVQLSCLGAGVNIPLIALNKLLGVEMPWSFERVSKKISYIESPVIIP